MAHNARSALSLRCKRTYMYVLGLGFLQDTIVGTEYSDLYASPEASSSSGTSSSISWIDLRIQSLGIYSNIMLNENTLNSQLSTMANIYETSGINVCVCAI